MVAKQRAGQASNMAFGKDPLACWQLSIEKDGVDIDKEILAVEVVPMSTQALSLSQIHLVGQ